MGYRGDRRPIADSNGRSLDDVRSRLSGLHFAKEQLSDGETEILFLAECLLRYIDTDGHEPSELRSTQRERELMEQAETDDWASEMDSDRRGIHDVCGHTEPFETCMQENCPDLRAAIRRVRSEPTDVDGRLVDLLERALDEGRNVMPDATDDEAHAIEALAAKCLEIIHG